MLARKDRTVRKLSLCFRPTLETLEDRLTPSGITHHGLMPIMNSSPVAIVTKPIIHPDGPPPPSGGADYWTDASGDETWSNPDNWYLGAVPNTGAALGVAAAFDGTLVGGVPL